jgi:hypothetical protein
MPMVRRSAALNLGKFAATVEAMYLKSDIMTFFRDLTQDGTCAFLEGLELNAEEWWVVVMENRPPFAHLIWSLDSFVEGIVSKISFCHNNHIL